MDIDAALLFIQIHALFQSICYIFLANYIQTSYVNMIFLDSHVQLYMETIQDLLDPSNDNIAIVEDPKTNDVSLPGATLVEIRDQQSFIELLRLGEAHRFAANTKLNTESSRSHAILMVNELTCLVCGDYIFVLLVVTVQNFYF